MSPVRLKVYGLLHLTRRGYLMCQGVGLLVLVALLFSRMWLPLPDPAALADRPLAAAGMWLIHNLHWLVLGVFLIEALETYLMLRRYHRAEAEHRQQMTI
ncbi:MAG: hypothetical protein ACK4RK_11350 [Gemmataceae bacterium]